MTSVWPPHPLPDGFGHHGPPSSRSVVRSRAIVQFPTVLWNNCCVPRDEKSESTIGSASFNRVDTSSFRGKVTNELRAAVIAGRMIPGVVYSAPALAQEFGVSATPVREAMVDLCSEGLVETVRNKGYRVTEVSDKDLDDITDLRLMIEPSAGRRAVAAGQRRTSHTSANWPTGSSRPPEVETSSSTSTRTATST